MGLSKFHELHVIVKSGLWRVLSTIILEKFPYLIDNTNFIDDKNEISDSYPLDLVLCKKKLINSQLSVVVPPEKMFNNYLYLSSTSEKFRRHLSDIAWI